MMEWLHFVVSAILILLVLIWKKSYRPKKFPPGPPVIPFLGNIQMFYRKPHLTMIRWKKEYGDVFSVFEGQTPVVILNDFDTVRKVFNDDRVTGRIVEMRNKSVERQYGLSKNDGEIWKRHRRFALHTLRDMGMRKTMHTAIVREFNELCKTFLETNHQPFNAKASINKSISNALYTIIFGERYSMDDPELDKLTHFIQMHFGSDYFFDRLAHAFPFLMSFPNIVRDKLRTSNANLIQLEHFIKKKVTDHIVNATAHKTDNYIDLYRNEKKAETDALLQATFDIKQLESSVFDLVLVGGHTTTITILWAFVFLLENPDIQMKVHEEIDSQFDKDELITYENRGRLPYTEAVINEVHRLGTLAPHGLPHRNYEEIIIGGYTIPPNTIILANYFSIHRDTRWWPDPEIFDPSRFLDENGKLIWPDGVAPFSVGKRSCIGESWAKMTLFIFISNILSRFQLQLPAGKSISSKDSYMSVTHFPNEFDLIFIPRK